MEASFLFICELLGTIAFAISGIRLAAGKNFDWFGAYIVGLVTAIGGGTLRDMLLDVPVFWMQQWWYLAVTALSLATVVLFRNILVRREHILFVFDSIGLAMFCVIGIQKSLEVGYSMWVASVMGIITGAFGGVLRDILINEEPLIFRKDIYATACLLGALVYWIIMEFGGTPFAQQISCAITVILIRVLTLKYSLSLPTLAPLPQEEIEMRRRKHRKEQNKQ
ncbi:MAG: trimeric intracellular cation channel family protein [Bacteroides sp.]|nr:trimeric intracellular cation channel family protein [Bacteroides sp.]